MGGCCRWGWLVRPGDTPDEAFLKTRGFPFCIVLVLSNFLLLGVFLLESRYEWTRIIGNALGALGSLIFMAGVLWTPIPAGYLADVLLGMITVGIVFIDIGHAATSYAFRAWALAVLVLDIALVGKRFHMPRFVIPVVLVYQVALQVESVSRFGLYEAGYWGTKGVEIS
eukprot:Hpha_TRINITY_DN16272_c0_g3::TRINITY_DN16272_c0_g3_i1::g.12508::m.12508